MAEAVGPKGMLSGVSPIDTSVLPPEPCISSLPEDLPAITSQELERLHVRASRDVDFEYFFEGRCSDAARAHYQHLNAKLNRRVESTNKNPAPRSQVQSTVAGIGWHRS